MNKYLVKFSSNEKLFQTKIITADSGNGAVRKLRAELKITNPKETIYDVSYVQVT